jgi:hypothetical protein
LGISAYGGGVLSVYFKNYQNINGYGKCVLELCNDSQLRILNGRTLGDTAGKATFFNHNGVSIDDYCICSSSFLSNL